MTQKTWYFSQTWSAKERQDGTLEPGMKISGTGISDTPRTEAAQEAARFWAEEYSHIKKGDPLFFIHAPFILDKGGK